MEILGFSGRWNSHVQVRNAHRLAYSPNTAALLTRSLDNGVDFTTMAALCVAGHSFGSWGLRGQRVSIAGVSWGLTIPPRERWSLLPEMNVYHYNGRFRGEASNGMVVQYGLVLSAAF